MLWKGLAIAPAKRAMPTSEPEVCHDDEVGESAAQVGTEEKVQ